MSDETQVVPTPASVESPPPAPRPEVREDDAPRVALNRLAAALTQQRNTRFLLEYLRLRRSLRS